MVATWLENPYWQFFCGETYLQTELPIDPSSLTRWRKRIGIKANIEMFLLADEMFKQKKGKISFVIGAALTPQQLPAELTDYEAANWVKNHVYSLKTSDETNH